MRFEVKSLMHRKYAHNLDVIYSDIKFITITQQRGVKRAKDNKRNKQSTIRTLFVTFIQSCHLIYDIGLQPCTIYNSLFEHENAKYTCIIYLTFDCHAIQMPYKL